MTRDENPFLGYTIVGVLYCSGDLHAGTVNNSWGPQAGLANTESVLAWALDNFPVVDSLVIAGSSAGSLATTLLANHILRRFRGRFSRGVVIADSYADVFPPSMTPTLMRLVNFCAGPAVQEEGPAAVASCEAGTLAVSDLYLGAMRSFPGVAFSNVVSKTDGTKTFFWNLWVQVQRTGEPLIEGNRLFACINEVFRKYNRQPNFVSYVIDSSHHVFLTSDFLYTADASGEEGLKSVAPALTEWISKLLSSDDAAVTSVCHGARRARIFWSTFLGAASYCDLGQDGKLLALPGRTRH